MATKGHFTSAQYEQDPRWEAVDEYTVSRTHPSSRPNSDALTHALETSKANGLPDIGTYPALGKFLALQCRIGNAKHALEVGTLGGYTSIWLATQNPDLRVTTVEIDPKHAEVARENLTYAGVSDRVEVILGAGVEVLSKLKDEIDSGGRPKFGFTFIDADKPNNWAYFDLAVKMSLPGACIIVDNVVRKGSLVAPETQGQEAVQGARKVIENAGKDPRVEATVLQTVGEKNYDGILLAAVK